MFQRITDSDSLEVRQRLTENHMAQVEASYSRFIVNAVAAGDAQVVADATRSYIAIQHGFIHRNDWGLTAQEVTDGLSKAAAASVAALNDLATVTPENIDAATMVIVGALPAMGIASNLIAAELGPTLQRIQRAHLEVSSPVSVTSPQG